MKLHTAINEISKNSVTRILPLFALILAAALFFFNAAFADMNTPRWQYLILTEGGLTGIKEKAIHISPTIRLRNLSYITLTFSSCSPPVKELNALPVSHLYLKDSSANLHGIRTETILFFRPKTAIRFIRH